MTSSAWNDTVTILSGWLPLDENQRGPSALIAPRLTGYSLDSVERILQRLTLEQATTKAFSSLRHQRDIDLAYWQIMLVHGWIQMSQQQTEPGMIAAAADRSEKVLGKIVEWYNRGGFMVHAAGTTGDDDDDDDVLPVSAMCLLVNEWLRLKNSAGTVRAIDLLLSWTDGEETTGLLEEYKNDVSVCCNQTMEQATALLLDNTNDNNDSLQASSHELATRMQTLQSFGWTDLVVISDLSSKLAAKSTLKPLESDTIDTGLPTNDAFWKEMKDLIAAAYETDYD